MDGIDSLDLESPQPPPEDEALFAATEPSSETAEIDQTKPNVGLALLENRFATSPEALALNTAVSLIVALDRTENAIRNGPHSDTKLFDTNSQELLSSILAALTDRERRRSGYSRLFESLKDTSGSSNEVFSQFLLDLKDEIDRHMQRFSDWTISEKYAEAQNIRPAVQFLEFITEQFVEELVTHGSPRRRLREVETIDDRLLWELEMIAKEQARQPHPRLYGISDFALQQMGIEIEYTTEETE